MCPDRSRPGGYNRTPIAIQRAVPVMAAENQEGSVPVPMPASPTEGRICVEVRHKNTKIEASASMPLGSCSSHWIRVPAWTPRWRGSVRLEFIIPISSSTSAPIALKCSCMMASACGRVLDGSTKAALSVSGARHDRGMPLIHEQLQAIVVGLPWERLDESAKIRVLLEAAPRKLMGFFTRKLIEATSCCHILWIELDI